MRQPCGGGPPQGQAVRRPPGPLRVARRAHPPDAVPHGAHPLRIAGHGRCGRPAEARGLCQSLTGRRAGPL